MSKMYRFINNNVTMKGKKMKSKQVTNKSVAVLLVLGLMMAACTFADSPRLLNFQGRLTDTLGDPIVGNSTITFSLYDVAAGGTPLWTETQSVTSNDEGLYSVLLGSVTALNLDFDIQYYLGITVSGESEMTPRFQLASTAYSLNGITSVNNVKNGGGNIDLVAGTNITITPDDVMDTIRIDAAGSTGGVTSITAGNGLTKTTSEPDVTLEADMSVLAAASHSHTVTSSWIQDGTITTADLAFTPLTNPYTGDVTINGTLDLTNTLYMNMNDIYEVDDIKADNLRAEDVYVGGTQGSGGATTGNIFIYDSSDNQTIELDSAYNGGGSVIVRNNAGQARGRLGGDDYGELTLQSDTNWTTIQIMGGYGNSGGSVRVNGTQVHDYADVFSFIDSANPQPGQVVSIATDGKLDISSAPYDLKVAGIVSGAGDLKPGMIVGGDENEANTAPIAVSGRVYCYVDATENAVEVGDLLTTSRTLGYAMKAADRELAFGAVLGKAMESMPKGEKGLLLVLVCLN